MTENDGAYRAAKSDFEAFVEKVTAVMIEDVDATIPELPLKDVVSQPTLPVLSVVACACRMDKLFEGHWRDHSSLQLLYSCAISSPSLNHAAPLLHPCVSVNHLLRRALSRRA